MIRSRQWTVGLALFAALALTLAACSNSGGKKAAEAAANPVAGHANTPHYTFAMITHAAPGDTFWDIIRKGEAAAAAKDNVTVNYSNNDDPTKQATLIQDAINSKVDGIAVTDPDPQAICPSIKKAVAAGIPVVMFNAGVINWQQCGGMSFFGQDETIAGIAAGKRLASEGAKKVLCVLQAQGQVQLEARCDGVKQGLRSTGTMEKLYVDGTNNSAMLSSMSAKLSQDKGIDHVITLGAPVALVALQAVGQATSNAKVVTFDTNPALVTKIKSGQVVWAVDQQPFLQGYESIDALWLFKVNGNILGGGQTVLTGPSFIDSSNIGKVAVYASRGTR